MKKKLSAVMLICMLFAACAGSFTCAAEGTDAVSPKPVAWYTFDDSGNLGADSSGNGNDLTVKGSPEYKEDGKFGGAVYFDGNSALIAQSSRGQNDFVDNIIDTKGKLTVAFWTKNSTEDFGNVEPNGWRRIVSNGADWGHSGGTATGFTILNNPDDIESPANINSSFVPQYDNNDYNSHLYANDCYVITQFSEDWVFTAVTVDVEKNSVKYYRNGVEYADVKPALPDKATKMALSNASAPFALGSGYNPGHATLEYLQPYVGLLDQAGIFDKVLTTDEIAYVMNNLSEPSDRPDGEKDKPETGKFYEDGHIIFRFDGIRNIHDSITENNYCFVSLLEKSVKLKFWKDGPFVRKVIADPEDYIDLDEYKYFKIKYCGKTQKEKSTFMFSTVENPNEYINGMLEIERRNDGVWDERIFDMSELDGWNGKMTGWELLPTQIHTDEDCLFIEYMAFFKTEAEAKEFGGLTDRQKNGEDEVSLYFTRGYVNPYLGYGNDSETAGGSEKDEKTNVFSSSNIISFAIGTALASVATAVIALSAKATKKKTAVGHSDI